MELQGLSDIDPGTYFLGVWGQSDQHISAEINQWRLSDSGEEVTEDG